MTSENERRAEALRVSCMLNSLVYRSLTTYDLCNDGFCHECQDYQGPAWQFTNAGGSARWLLWAIVEIFTTQGTHIDPAQLAATLEAVQR